MNDHFNGDTPHLIRCIEALLELDADGALMPHGIPGHARTMLEAAAVRLSAEPVAEVVAGTENFGAVQFSGPIPPKGTKLYVHGVMAVEAPKREAPPGKWKVDMPDGTYGRMPGDPPGPASVQAVIGGYVYDVEPQTGKLIACEPPTGYRLQKFNEEMQLRAAGVAGPDHQTKRNMEVDRHEDDTDCWW